MERDTVRRLAQLAKLRLSEAEEERAAARIERLLGYFARLQEVDTEGTEASPYPLPLPPATRPDVPGKPLAQDDVLANAPDARGGCFRLPRTVEG
ncbi:MAG: Asp-tRNA(Asn)/Glu-tRNA(Gln) amidotransferase subunit GatC [Planctomycetota bacterium]